MTSSIGFYIKPTVFESNSFEDEDTFENEDNEEFNSQGYLYEVPYTSSSVDRSSIGSIPWADDAIKINKMEWEKVEKILSGLEPLLNADEDLRREISDWQKKFPHLLSEKKRKANEFKGETLDIDSLPSLGLTSDDEDDNVEDKKTLTRNRNNMIHSTSKSSEEESNLCQLMDNFTLKSIPFKLSQRVTNRAQVNKRKCSSSTSSYSLSSPCRSSTIEQVPVATTSNNCFRMPPILNVLDSKRKFRNLAQKKNPSFVQLTEIQQVKSAAVSQEQKNRSHFQTNHRSAWRMPFVVNRFSNNRNSIILPSIPSNLVIHRNVTQPITITPNSAVASSTSSSSGTRGNKSVLGFTANVSTQTNTSNTTTSGRSISAAVKYPRYTAFNALYLPYSVSKFRPFN